MSRVYEDLDVGSITFTSMSACRNTDSYKPKKDIQQLIFKKYNLGYIVLGSRSNGTKKRLGNSVYQCLEKNNYVYEVLMIIYGLMEAVRISHSGMTHHHQCSL